MIKPVLHEDEQDALKEVINIAMGKAASALGTVMDSRVYLQAPEIRVVVADEVLRALEEENGARDKPVTALRQAFLGELRGEVITLHSQGDLGQLMPALGYGTLPTDSEKSIQQAERECLMDVSNMLTSAVLNGLCEILQMTVTFGPPSILGEKALVSQLVLPPGPIWHYALLANILFVMPDGDFVCRMLILFPDSVLEALRSGLTRFVEGF